MDLYVERQCIDQMKEGKVKQFMLLYDANFAGLYKYVARRVSNLQEIDRIVRLTFFDALGQVQNTPTETSFQVWLYSLARPRIWAYLDKASFPERQGLISRKEAVDLELEENLFAKAENMFGKLSLEEREILKLKFFEQVADGDVMTVLGFEDANVGPKIYRVLKRAHFLLFGESDERHGVYFGELSGFMERVRNTEEIEIPEVLNLTLKNELVTRIEKKDFAIEGNIVEEKNEETPFAVKEERRAEKETAPSGVGDPAKIFVEAVAEMREEEALEKIKEERKAERRENLMMTLDRWKGVFVAIPVLIFIVVVGFVSVNMFMNGLVERGYPTACAIEVDFEGDFSDNEMRSVNKGISDRLCGHFDDVASILINRTEAGKVYVEVNRKDWFLEYNFVKKPEYWKIKKYARTANSDGESGEV